MSEPGSDIIPIDSEFPYDVPEAWWIVAGIIDASCHSDIFGTQQIERRFESNGMQATMTKGDQALGRFVLTGNELKSELWITPMPGSDGYWNQLYGLLLRMSNATAVH